MNTPTPAPAAAPDEHDEPVHGTRLWRDGEWTATVIKNEDDEGWAVAMTLRGHDEPALVGPWTMGRDKKNPKPLDSNAFNTLVKTAREVIRRHEQQHRERHHKAVAIDGPDGRLRVTLDIVPNDDDPHALLSAFDATGERLAQVRTRPDFRLTSGSAAAWVDSGFQRPR